MMTDERLAKIERVCGDSPLIANLVAEIRRLRAQVEAMRPAAEAAEAWEIVKQWRLGVRFYETSCHCWFVDVDYKDFRNSFSGDGPIAAIQAAKAWLEEQEKKP